MGKVTLSLDDAVHKELKNTGIPMNVLVRRGVALALAEFYEIEVVPKEAPWMVHRREQDRKRQEVHEGRRSVALPALEPVEAPEPVAATVAQEAPPVATPVLTPEPEPPKQTKPKLPSLNAPDSAVHYHDGRRWVDALWACETLGIEYDDLKLNLDDEDILNVETVPHIDSLGVQTVVSLAHDKGISATKVRTFERWYETLA